MKKLLFVALLSLPLFLFSQTDFNKGYEKGYKEGYCYEDFGCIPPNTPIPPIPNIGYDSYQDGYNRGFSDGKSKKSGDSSSGSSSRRRQARGISTQDAMAIGAASSSGNQPIQISDEAAQQVGDALAQAMIAAQISKAKKKLRRLPAQYTNFNNLKTAFDINNAINVLLSYEYKAKSQDEKNAAKNEIYSTYDFSLKELVGDEIMKDLRIYEGNWRTYKKENKSFAKSEEKKLKEYEKALKKNKS
jgi:hypothetical protein